MAKMNYTINLEKNLIYCEFVGEMPAEELIEFIKAIRTDSKFHNNLNTISDIRRAKLSKGFIEMHMLAEYVKNTASERGNFKLALLCDHEKSDSAKLYKVLTSDSHVKECFTIEQAEKWVIE